MKTSVLTLIMSLSLAACSHTAAPKADRFPAASTDLQKVSEFFNKDDGQPSQQQPNKTAVVAGRLVALEATSKSISGHFIEDCRKAALRQALLDTTQAGEKFFEFSRKGSHRITNLNVEGFKHDRVGTMVAIRVDLGSQRIAERTFRYDHSDDGKGACKIDSSGEVTNQHLKRKEVEELYRTQIWPGIPETMKQVLREAMQRKHGSSSDATIAEKSVGKLIEFECEQYSLNKAAQSAQNQFIQKYGSQPIMLIDFGKSKVESNISRASHEDPLKSLKGQWTFMLADQSGSPTEIVSTEFDVVETADKCK